MLISMLYFLFELQCNSEKVLEGWNTGTSGADPGFLETGFSPPVKHFTDCSKAVLLLWIFNFSILCLLCLCAHLFMCALWSPAGKCLTSWLSFVVSYCEFVTFPLVSLARCGN